MPLICRHTTNVQRERERERERKEDPEPFGSTMCDNQLLPSNLAHTHTAILEDSLSENGALGKHVSTLV